MGRGAISTWSSANEVHVVTQKGQVIREGNSTGSELYRVILCRLPWDFTRRVGTEFSVMTLFSVNGASLKSHTFVVLDAAEHR